MFPEKKTSLLQRGADLFRKQPEPKELVRKWQSELRTAQRAVERQIREIERTGKGAEKTIKEQAKRGDLKAAKVLARELVHTRKTIGRLYTNKAHMISLNAQLTEQLGLVRVAGTLNRSTEVMALVNDLIKAPQLAQTVQQMSKEMMKAGLIEEVVSDTLDSALDTEDLEEETEAEVDKVLMEVAGETLAQLTAAPSARPAAQAAPAQEEAAPDEEELQARLAAIRS